MNGLEISCLAYLGIGLLITIFVVRGKSFTEGTKWYQKVLGLAFMIVLWPIVICVLSPEQMP
jgi:Mn2+/Fe2+ NRAMP family transporter